MDRIELKQAIEEFMTDKGREYDELFVSVKVNGHVITDFHISEDGRCIDENSSKTELVINNIYSDTMGLAPDMVHIVYENVKSYVVGTHPREIADIMTLVYENGTELELGFLRR